MCDSREIRGEHSWGGVCRRGQTPLSPRLAKCTEGVALAFRDAESEKRLIKKCRELNNEVVQNTAKVQTALKLSEEDQSTINSLQAEVDKAWKASESAIG